MIELIPVSGLPEITEGDDLAALVHTHADVRPGDVVVITSKVVSKALGLVADPSVPRADLVLQESTGVLSERTTTRGMTRVVTAAAGPVMAGAGIDSSNSDDDVLLLLPHDPDAVARDLHGRLADLLGHDDVAVVLSDTAGRAWRDGVTDFALGSHHLTVREDLRGLADTHGHDLAVTVRDIADEIAAAADLVKGKLDRTPVAIVRGAGKYVRDDGSGARDLVRAGASDWFALGRAEAVRDALGVTPGTPLAYEAGVESVHPEDLSTRVTRAWAVATLPEADAEEYALDGSDGSWRVLCTDPYLLGRVTARFEVALAGERLAVTGVARGTSQVELTVAERA